jgi:hypothetical protein
MFQFSFSFVAMAKIRQKKTKKLGHNFSQVGLGFNGERV